MESTSKGYKQPKSKNLQPKSKTLQDKSNQLNSIASYFNKTSNMSVCWKIIEDETFSLDNCTA